VNWYLYKLIPPRGNFASTMSEDELTAMTSHWHYWGRYVAEGRVLIFSPVADPAGDWGLAIVGGESVEEINALGSQDPAVTSKVATFEVLPLPSPITSEPSPASSQQLP
jgi:hypothetical protein